jgi:hypothetical protein
MDSALYCHIFDDFVKELDDVELTQCYFQQDSAMCHTSNVTMELTESFFPNQSLKGCGPQNPLTLPAQILLWGLLKDRVYANKLRTLQDLKEKLERLWRITANMQTRVEACLLENGRHLQHLL